MADKRLISNKNRLVEEQGWLWPGRLDELTSESKGEGSTVTMGRNFLNHLYRGGVSVVSRDETLRTVAAKFLWKGGQYEQIAEYPFFQYPNAFPLFHSLLIRPR